MKVEARVDVEQWADTPLAALVRITTPGGEVLENMTEITTPDGTTVGLVIPKPELWWPNGYGKQPLYQVEVSIIRKDDPQLEALDSRRYQIGLRTIELRQEPDEWGRSFVFVVNGVPILAKGSNWIPADSFPTRSTDQFLEELI